MKVLILGATSGIAQEVIKIYAERKADLYIVARSTERLNLVAQDATTRGAVSVSSYACEFLSEDSCKELLADLRQIEPFFDVVLLAFGTLPDQSCCERDWNVAREAIQLNFISPIYLLGEIANLCEARRSGTIAVIGSVAGDRGRKSNYIYGSAKGALALFLQGLRNRLSGSDVSVVTIKPGFVDTPMTAHLKKGVLFAQADQVARGIVSAIDSKRDIVYLPFFWLGIMTIIKAIPERIFKRLSL